MKVVTASTPEQQSYAQDLIDDIYNRLFPFYFTKSYIEELKHFGLLELPDIENLNLMEIMKLTAAGQTIAAILEAVAQGEKELEDYEEAFNRSAAILQECDIDFPFQLKDFGVEHKQAGNKLSSGSDSSFFYM